MVYRTALIIIFCTLVFSNDKVTDRLNSSIQENISIKTEILVQLNELDSSYYSRSLESQGVTCDDLALLMTDALISHSNHIQEKFLSKYQDFIEKNDIEILNKYWITNTLHLKVNNSLIPLFSDDILVEEIDLNGQLKQIEDNISSNDISQSLVAGVEPGILAIKADKLWALGFKGQGTIVMSIDTGVDSNHPALKNNWLGLRVANQQAWKDYRNLTTRPDDCSIYHGSHVMGIICGNASNNQIGVAPNAEWIASNAIASNACNISPAGVPFLLNETAVLDAMQWAMNPDGNTQTTADRPIVINNSWYDPNAKECSMNIYKSALTNIESSGIAVIFAAGNLIGATDRKIRNPANLTDSTGFKNIPVVAAVGSINAILSNYPLSSFSCVGPSNCTGPGTLRIKPDLVAPGEQIRSCGANSSYRILSGTSMAAPHVAGAIALLKSAFPNRTGTSLKAYLLNFTKDLGTTGKDNSYGFGMLDVEAAYQAIKSGIILN